MWIATGRGKSSGLLEEDRRSFILVGRLFLVSPTLKESHWMQVRRYKVAGGASGMGMDGIGELAYKFFLVF